MSDQIAVGTLEFSPPGIPAPPRPVLYLDLDLRAHLLRRQTAMHEISSYRHKSFEPRGRESVLCEWVWLLHDGESTIEGRTSLDPFFAPLPDSSRTPMSRLPSQHTVLLYLSAVLRLRPRCSLFSNCNQNRSSRPATPAFMWREKAFASPCIREQCIKNTHSTVR